MQIFIDHEGIGVDLTLVLHSVHVMGASKERELVVDLEGFGVGPTLLCMAWVPAKYVSLTSRKLVLPVGPTLNLLNVHGMGDVVPVLRKEQNNTYL